MPVGGGASISRKGGKAWFASGSSKTGAGGDTAISSGSGEVSGGVTTCLMWSYCLVVGFTIILAVERLHSVWSVIHFCQVATCQLNLVLEVFMQVICT